MRILLDMDSILANLTKAWFEENNRRYDDDLTIEKVKTWDTHLYSKGGEKMYDILNTPGLYKNLEPLPGALEAVKALHDAGHELYVVTACMVPIAAGEKLEWYQEHLPFLGKRNLVMAHDKYLFPADMLVDDGPHNAMAYRQAHRGSKILTIQYPYNENCSAYDLIAPDYNDTAGAWAQILEYIRQNPV